MKVSFNQTTGPNVRDNNGFGYAAKMCKDSLVRLGHEVAWREPTADIEINFIQPDKWHWTGPYRIGYLPWESTEFREGWIEKLDSCDEVWTPSPVIAEWMVDAGLKKTPKIYEHGVESLWAPAVRPQHDRYKVLHHGAEAIRKGGNEAIWETIATFKGNEDKYQLVLKMLNEYWHVHDTDTLVLHKSKMPIEDLVALYQDCDLFLYPSWGEGFGLTPLQAMATGMPVLITKGWAPYQDMLGDESLIDSTLVPSPWQEHHPGMMFEPNRADLREKLWAQYENREKMMEMAQTLAPAVHKRYNWDLLTQQAFAHLSG